MRIKSAEQIRYQAPQWLVEKTGSICDAEDIAVLEQDGIPLADPIKGWPPYTHIMTCGDSCYLVEVIA